MVGNDIIDIVEAQKSSNWQRPRFLEKLFTLEEQEQIYNSENPFLMVWRFWSIKEAAYKLYTQLNPSRFYNPRSFKCEFNNTVAKVSYKSFVCYVKTKTTLRYILSEARLECSKLNSGFEAVLSCPEKNLSHYIKETLLSKIAEHFNILKLDLNLVKTKFGVPLIYLYSKKLPISISISHHGNYGAYAISYK